MLTEGPKACRIITAAHSRCNIAGASYAVLITGAKEICLRLVHKVAKHPIVWRPADTFSLFGTHTAIAAAIHIAVFSLLTSRSTGSRVEAVTKESIAQAAMKTFSSNLVAVARLFAVAAMIGIVTKACPIFLAHSRIAS